MKKFSIICLVIIFWASAICSIVCGCMYANAQRRLDTDINLVRIVELESQLKFETADKNQLSYDLSIAKAELEILKTLHSEDTEAIAQKEAEIEALTQALAAKQARLDKLNADYMDLRTAYGFLQDQYDRLLKDIEEGKEQNSLIFTEEQFRPFMKAFSGEGSLGRPSLKDYKLENGELTLIMSLNNMCGSVSYTKAAYPYSTVTVENLCSWLDDMVENKTFRLGTGLSFEYLLTQLWLSDTELIAYYDTIKDKKIIINDYEFNLIDIKIDFLQDFDSSTLTTTYSYSLFLDKPGFYDIGDKTFLTSISHPSEPLQNPALAKLFLTTLEEEGVIL